MNPADLQSGFYRITADAQNPALDKRVNSDWRVMRLLAGSVLCCVERERHDSPQHTEVCLEPTQFGTHLAGYQYASTRSLLVGWRYTDRFVDAGETAKPLLSVLLALIEPIPVADVDMALYLFNTQGAQIGWRDVAIQLMLQSRRSPFAQPTAHVFSDTRARVAAHWVADREAGDRSNGDVFTKLDAADAMRALR